MPITPEQIDAWRSLPTETETVEFKEAKNQFDTSKVYAYCAAIANEGGGHLLLGIHNKPPRPVVGTSAFLNRIEIEQKIFRKLGFRVDVEEVNHPAGRIVVFIIPSRPKGAAFPLDGSYLMRSGEELVPMSQDRLRKIFLEGEPSWCDERSSQVRLSSADVLELLDTDAYFGLQGLPLPTTPQGTLDRLHSDGIVDEAGGRYSITKVGALLFAKQLDMFPDVKRKAYRVVTYAGDSKTSTTLSDITANKGYAVGFQSLVRFVNSKIPQNEVIKDALRKEIKLVPEVAVRELIANALIHQDLSISGASVTIEIYSNRLDISNPGTPVVPPERFIDCYQSRNERLATLMRKMRICEERGSGIDKVIAIAETLQLPAPDFRVLGNRCSVAIMAPKEFDDMDREERLRACYQHCVLRWIIHNRMTNQSLRERFHLPEKKSAVVSQIIAAAIEANQIRPDEAVGTSRRFARYIPYWA